MPMRLRCSFCGKDQHAVKTLFKGLTQRDSLMSVYICDECVGICNDILAEEKPVD